MFESDARGLFPCPVTVENILKSDALFHRLRYRMSNNSLFADDEEENNNSGNQDHGETKDLLNEQNSDTNLPNEEEKYGKHLFLVYIW